jgi:hypothetical protein
MPTDIALVLMRKAQAEAQASKDTLASGTGHKVRRLLCAS